MWITEAYLINFYGNATVTALGLSGTVFEQFEASARSTVGSVMQYAGYAIPDSLDSSSLSAPFLQKIVSGLVLRDSLQMRKGIEMPQIQPSISEAMWLLDAVYDKKMPIPGLEPVAANSYGGSEHSSVVGPYARPAVFGPGKLTGF